MLLLGEVARSELTWRPAWAMLKIWTWSTMPWESASYVIS